MPASPPFRPLAGDGAARLRGVLDDAGFTLAAIAGVIGEEALTHGRRSIPLVLRRTAQSDRISTLIRLFLAPVAVPLDAAAKALEPVPVDDLLDAGVLAAGGGGTVHGGVHLRHHDGLILAVDPEPLLTGLPVAEDHVMGLSRGTLMLSRLTDTLDAEAAVDIGTGSGLQALVLSRRATRVVATDITDRAVAMARFNAALNGITTVDVRQGDLFEPVHGEQFDVVVSNPPYVVAPPLVQRFVSGRREADGISAHMARTAPRHLRPGGRAYILAEWIVPFGRDWEERVSPWFEGSGCDASVLAFSTTAVDEYATRWIPPGEHDAEGYAREFDAWMRWYAERGIEAITFGLITMRRREGTGESLRMTTPPLRFNDIDGDDLQLALALGRWVRMVDPDAFLATRLRLTDDARLLRECVVEGGEWVWRSSAIGAENAIANPVEIDTAIERLAARCDGRRTVAELLADDTASREGSDGETAARLVPELRRLVERGLLLPVDEEG